MENKEVYKNTLIYTNNFKVLKYIILHKISIKTLIFICVNIVLFLILVMYSNEPPISPVFNFLITSNQFKEIHFILYDFIIAIITGEIIWILTTYLPEEIRKYKAYLELEKHLVYLLIYVEKIKSLLHHILDKNDKVAINEIKNIYCKNIILGDREIVTNNTSRPYKEIFQIDDKKIEKDISIRNYNNYAGDIISLLTKIKNIKFYEHNHWLVISRENYEQYLTLYSEYLKKYPFLKYINTDIELKPAEEQFNEQKTLSEILPRIVNPHKNNELYKLKIHPLIDNHYHYSKVYHEIYPNSDIFKNFLFYNIDEDILDYYDKFGNYICMIKTGNYILMANRELKIYTKYSLEEKSGAIFSIPDEVFSNLFVGKTINKIYSRDEFRMVMKDYLK